MLLLFCAHGGCFVAQLRHLECIGEEDDDRIIEEGWSMVVVVTLKLYDVLVPSILGMKLFAMLRLNKVVLQASSEESGDETLVYMVNGR